MRYARRVELAWAAFFAVALVLVYVALRSDSAGDKPRRADGVPPRLTTLSHGSG